ncbi:MAG: LytTR family DNA-binding domain-containing protein [Lachnospiraceae bacterium]
MIVKLEQDLSRKDIEILIKYANVNKDVERITMLLQSVYTRIKCKLDGSEKLVNASDIYYIESVDKRTFVYCEKSVYRTESRLYQLAEDLAHLEFVQINKSCVLNINILDSIKPLLNSRMEATLKNGERLYVTRKYLDNLKQALKGGI